MSQTKKEDLYRKWQAEGKLQENLDMISMLVLAHATETQICDYLDIKIKDYRELKTNHIDLKQASDPTNIRILAKCLKTLKDVATGYYKTNKRKLVYQNKKGVDKATFEENEVWHEPNPATVFYLMEKLYGSAWATNAEMIDLQKKKIESNKEEWK